jgi:tetratricopeptide (TPR) repeat protein
MDTTQPEPNSRAALEAALAAADATIRAEPQANSAKLRAVVLEVQLGRVTRAYERFAAIESGLPDDAAVAALKAHLLRLLERFEPALESCEVALGRGIDSADLAHVHALILQGLGRVGEALAGFDRAALLARNPASALSDKGVLFTQLGRLAEACACFDAALGHSPALADAWYNKAQARRFVPGDADIAAMARLLAGPIAPRERTLLHFALGKALMDVAQPDAAFAHFHAGNRLKRAAIAYDADAVEREMAAIAARPLAVAASAAPGVARRSERPVFVVGMPRSGSTLVEQMLAMHPAIRAAGERLRLRDRFERVAAAPAPASDELLEQAAAEIESRLDRSYPNAERVIDKDLMNFRHLGVIHAVFPRTRIIHCRRDPLDTCLSAYTRLFEGDIDFAYELTELGRHYRAYHGLMAHWRRVLPAGVLLDVDHEALVADPERELRRILAFIGLPWDPACLRFYENPNAVATASAAQVRMPLFRSHPAGSPQLRAQVAPLIEALGGLAAPDSRLSAARAASADRSAADS